MTFLFSTMPGAAGRVHKVFVIVPFGRFFFIFVPPVIANSFKKRVLSYGRTVLMLATWEIERISLSPVKVELTYIGSIPVGDRQRERERERSRKASKNF